MKLYRIIIITLCAYALISCGGAEERKAVYLERAKVSMEAGDLDKARIELKNVLQIDPKYGEAYFQLGKVFERQKDYRKAYGNYLKAEELNPELLGNHARLGRFYLLLMNDAEKAQEKIDLILSKQPDNADGLLLKAALVLRKNEIDEAIKIAESIVERNPDHIEGASFLASLYLREKKNKEAVAILDAALKNNPDNEVLNKLLAAILVSDKNYERAEIIFKQFLERNPDNSVSFNNLAAFYTQTGEKAKAEDILRASIENDSDDEDRILTFIKYIKATKGNEDAIKELENYIAKNKNLGKLRIALAELFILNNDKASATKIFKVAIKDFSEEVTGVTARTALASIHISDKEFEKASEVIDDALSVSPNDPKVNFLRAKLAVRDKDMEKAIISLRIVTKEMPENVEAFLLLAAVYQQQENKEQVKSTLNSAFESNRTNAAALLKLAQYHLSRDINMAEKVIDSYISQKGGDYEGLSIKAAILNQKKEHADAYKIAATLREHFPDKANGYLQAIPFYGQDNNKKEAIALLETGYLNVKDNRKILLLLTTFQVEDKKFDIVEKRLKAEIKSSPKDIQLKVILAKVHMVNNKLDQSISLLNEVIEINSAVEETYLLLSQIHQSRNDIDAVKAILVKGVKNVKASLKIPLRLATIYEARKAYDKAIAVYQDLHKLHPTNLIIINNLASMLSDHGNATSDLDLAKKLADKLKDSEQPVFWDTVGWVYYKAGDYETAIKYLSKTIEKAPKINIFNYHLGMAYKMSGDKVQAKTYLEKSLENSEQFKQKDLAKAALKNL